MLLEFISVSVLLLCRFESLSLFGNNFDDANGNQFYDLIQNRCVSYYKHYYYYYYYYHYYYYYYYAITSNFATTASRYQKNETILPLLLSLHTTVYFYIYRIQHPISNHNKNKLCNSIVTHQSIKPIISCPSSL